MSAITAKASRKMKKYAVLTREPRCFLGSFDFSWEQRKLEDYLTVSVEKNTGNIYGRSDVLSVSGDYGIVNQIEFQGRSFAGASVYRHRRYSEVRGLCQRCPMVPGAWAVGG